MQKFKDQLGLAPLTKSKIADRYATPWDRPRGERSAIFDFELSTGPSWSVLESVGIPIQHPLYTYSIITSARVE